MTRPTTSEHERAVMRQRERTAETSGRVAAILPDEVAQREAREDSRELATWDTIQMPALSVNPATAGELLEPPAESLPSAPMPVIRPDGIADEAPVDEAPRWVLPVVIPAATQAGLKAVAGGAQGYLTLVRNLVKSSGVYAVASLGSPLIALILTPFLAHNLAPADYGRLTILTTAIGLAAGITQLGLGSAFFRAYNYDYTDPKDRRDVLTTVLVILFLSTLPTMLIAWVFAPAIAGALLGATAYAPLIQLAAGAVLMQNLTVPAFAWMRAESRAGIFGLLSIANSLATLIASVYFVGVAQRGVAGALTATGFGYAVVVICTVPLALLRAGARPRRDIALSVLAFGSPMILNVVANWVLQLSDRFLLGILGSYAETASYAVAYTLGTVLSTVIIGPFTLAWPTTMYSIARREDAAQVFKLVFRWLSMLLLFAAFGLSIVATVALDWLFPPSYHASALVIPIVAAALVFNGIYYVFSIGANIQRKTWIAAVFMTIAALSNVGLNLILIPHFGAMGAAVATLLAYIVLAAAAYIVNQRLYPIPFEIGRFTLAALGGAILFAASAWLGGRVGSPLSWGVSVTGLAVYAVYLGMLGNVGRVVRARARRLAARR